MDLIDRAAAIDAMKKWATQPVIMKSRHWNNLGKAITLDLIATVEEQPTIEAVPLDKLCEWLETGCSLSCVSCEHLFGGQWCKQHPELPYRCHRKEHWKDALTKWMEGLDDHR